MNPYRGCEFGCHYCYARYTHEYMELDGADFESKIYVKENAGALVERDLATRRFGASTLQSEPQPILTSRQSANSAQRGRSWKKWRSGKD